MVRSTAAASAADCAGASIDVAWEETAIAPRAIPAARNGIDIIKNPAIVAVSTFTASMPAMPAIVIPPGEVAFRESAVRSMMNMCSTTYRGPHAAR